MLKTALAFLASITLVCNIFAQAASPVKKDETQEKLEKQAVEFLRETAGDVANMHSMENRISFNAELAGLMWFHDDKEAKVMYGGVVSDFKELLAQFDAQMNSASMPFENELYGTRGMIGGFGQSPVERKFRIAMAVRQQIALTLAEHAPDIAYNFFYDSLGLISNPKFRKETEESDKYFEFQLMKQIAETNAAKAVEYGKESIKSGLDTNHIELLKKIYASDPDKGVDFGSAMLSRLRTDRSAVKNTYFYASLLTFGAANLDASKKPGGTKAVYPMSDLRDIADLFAQKLLDGGPDVETSSALMYADLIERYSPGRGTQIKAKFRSNKTMSNAFSATNISTGGSMSNRQFSNTSSNTNSEYAKAQRQREEREKADKKMMDDIGAIGSKQMPKDERDKLIASTRKIIAQTPGNDKKITALSLLAAQAAKAGDVDLADDIMRDAERLVNPQPKNYQDFMMSWMLASGYAEANPQKAFPLLEGTIQRANDTLAAFVKVAEFIDVNEEMIADGEVQVGMFGGSMIRGLTSELGMADGTIRLLARADFVKTRNLTNTFDRPEIRILAKMLVLRAILDNRPKKGASVDSLMVESGYDEASAAPPPPKPRPTPN